MKSVRSVNRWFCIREFSRLGGWKASSRAMVFSLLGLMLVSMTHAASFDCSKATLKVEELVCSDPALSRLDDEVALLYKGARSRAEERETIRLSQLEWLRQRNACDDIACVQASYSHRIIELRTQGLDLATESKPQQDSAANAESLHAKQFPPYPDIWDWTLPAAGIGELPDLFTLSNGDVLAWGRLLFGGQTVSKGELVVASPKGDLIRSGEQDLLTLSDGSRVRGVRRSVLFERISPLPGLEIVGVDGPAARGSCGHGPIESFFYVRNKSQGRWERRVVVFVILDKPRQQTWDRVSRMSESGEPLCPDDGPPGYTTRVVSASGIKMLALYDGTFLLPLPDRQIIRFDKGFRTRSKLLNSKVFVFDLGTSNLFIDEVLGRTYDLTTNGYQGVYDDLYEFLKKQQGGKK